MTEYDFSRGRWGHRVETMQINDGGRVLRVAGWSSPRPSAGDMLILAGDRAGTTTRYMVRTVRYEKDPPDMWFAELQFAPRKAEEKTAP